MNVEELLPHRGRMKLVDEIIEVDEERALTRSTVTDLWPFFDGKTVNALVLIELIAQTAGISNSWGGIKKHGDKFERKGWLVGIKRSRLLIDSIPLNTCIITRCENQFKTGELQGNSWHGQDQFRGCRGSQAATPSA